MTRNLGYRGALLTLMAAALVPVAATAPAAAVSSTPWTIQPTPSPSGAFESGLQGVSCTASDACTAVGLTDDGRGSLFETLAETWNGTTWSIQPTPDPKGAQSATLNAVSCSSADACTAVGSPYVDTSGASHALAETWNGTLWRIHATPSPPGAASSVLSGVSCTAASACTAVGSYKDSSGALHPLAETWDGTAWNLQSAPDDGTVGSYLTGVSCTPADVCIAVGSFFPRKQNPGSLRAMAEIWNGTSWSVMFMPSPGRNNQPLAIACPAADNCITVGDDISSLTQVALGEAWNGTKWTILSTPNPSASYMTKLTGVSCSAPGACTAVGNWFHYNTGRIRALTEVWNGTAWGIQPSANPVGAADSGLGGVSCLAASGCTAVGSYSDTNRGPDLTLAEHRG